MNEGKTKKGNDQSNSMLMFFFEFIFLKSRKKTAQTQLQRHHSNICLHIIYHIISMSSLE